MSDHFKYALITAAKNEQAYIEKTLQAVAAQSVLPVKWIIVSDGSTDKTDQIVQKYATEYPFIELITGRNQQTRDFGSKVRALNHAYSLLTSQNSTFDFIGILDADVSFSNNYYQGILEKFRQNEKLGVAGGDLYNRKGEGFTKVMTAPNSVPGPIQMYRRSCFDMIGGGLLPLKEGGEDAAAETMARMHGWEVKLFPEFRINHYRPFNAANMNVINSGLNFGIRDYMLGYHPLFEIIRSLRRFTDRPFVIASLLRLTGYFRAAVSRRPRTVNSDFVKYIRSEQKSRLRAMIPGNK